MSSSSTLNMTCPQGGAFYACEEGLRFVGCCGSNPCSSIGCPSGNLEIASFPPAQYGKMPDQQCDSGLFYTCAATQPPFWGCCNINPCVNGSCPRESFAPAFLSNNPESAAPYLALNQWTTSSGSSSESNHAGAIAGGVVGGLAVIAALVLGLYFLIRRRRNRRDEEPDNGTSLGRIELETSLHQTRSDKEQYAKSPTQMSQGSWNTPPPNYGFVPNPPPPQEMPAQERYEMDGVQARERVTTDVKGTHN